MAKVSGAAVLRVTLAHCTAPGQVVEILLELPVGTTVEQALLASGIAALREVLPDQQVGIWGKSCTPNQQLREGDRVEIYRPLLVDPKVARRERFARQGSRSAGLFARNRKT